MGVSGQTEVQGKLAPQFLAGFILNILNIVYGMIIGWTAPMQPLLQANYTGLNETAPLGENSEPFSDETMSWVTGVFCLGGVVGTPIAGFLATGIGRRYTVILSAVLLALCYFFTILATNDITVYAARIFAGLGGAGVCVVIPMYFGESVDNRIRGILASSMNLSICIGIVLSYAIGSYTSYFTLGLISLVLNLIFLVIAVLWLPETPVYALLQEKPKQAIKALSRVRGLHPDDIDFEVMRITSEAKQAKAAGGTMSLMEMLRDTPTRRGLLIGLTVLTAQHGSGIAPVINYTVAIFNASGSNISSSLATITVGSLQIVGAFIATLLMDRAGRKVLLLISATGMAISLTPLAYFFHLKQQPDIDEEYLKSIGWLPVTCLGSYIFTFSLGFGSVSFVLISELFKTEARSAACSICLTSIWLIPFFILKFFTRITDALGTDVCFAMFAIFSALSGLFVLFCMPETKGKSIDAIMIALGGEEKHNGLLRNSPTPMVTDKKSHDNF